MRPGLIYSRLREVNGSVDGSDDGSADRSVDGSVYFVLPSYCLMPISPLSRPEFAATPHHLAHYIQFQYQIPPGSCAPSPTDSATALTEYVFSHTPAMTDQLNSLPILWFTADLNRVLLNQVLFHIF